MEDHTKDIQHYLVALKKRKIGIITIFVVILSVTTAVAFLLPAVYQSSSTILIKQQEIPRDLVASTVTSFAAERLQSIQARVMTRTNLLKIIEKFKLYEAERKVKTTEEIIANMRESVKLDIISAEVVDPRTGRATAATIAFTLSFKGENPGKVQRVVNELTSLYLNENLTSRTQEATNTSEYFKAESERLTNTISRLEKELAEFKQIHAASLPELQNLNMQKMQRQEAELTALDAKLNILHERRFYLNGQLTQVEPGGGSNSGSAERLKLLETEYASIRSKYSSEHPDVIRLKNEIESLSGDTVTDKTAMAEELVKLRAELAEKEKQYTAEHPDVIALHARVDSLNDELNNAADAEEKAEDKIFKGKPDNPLYLNLQTQLASADIELKSVTMQKELLIKKITALEADLYKTPQVEREYTVLKRDYQNAIIRYQETQEKQVRADAAMLLESESKGEKFTLIDPATLPEKPISPNRPAIVFLGFALALGCGLGFAIVADAISGTLRGARSAYRLLGALPLSVIPYEMNLQDRMKTRKVKKRVVLLFIAVIVFAVVIIHVVVTPLDVLWFRLLRKFDSLTV